MSKFNLEHSPIVEAVLDIECDMPPGFQLAAIEKHARDLYRDRYPKFQQKFIQQHKIEQRPDAPAVVTSTGTLAAFQFFQEGNRQLVQVRQQGFSFNRLAPYAGFDAYASEVEQSWSNFVSATRPVQIRKVALRNINRIVLPTQAGRLELEDFFRVCPKPPYAKLDFTGFMNQHSYVDPETNFFANVTLSSVEPTAEALPVIFDIEVMSLANREPDDWTWIRQTIESLRSLKSSIFKSTLTDRCLSQFQQ